MNTLNKEEAYINFLECVNKAQDIESLLKDTFKIIQKAFSVSRVQLWEEVSDLNELSIFYEYYSENETSMLKFRVSALPESTKRLFQEVTLWEYLNITDEKLIGFNIKSLIGVGFQLPEKKIGVLVLSSKEKNKKLNDTEINFLIRIKNQLEVSIEKVQMLQKNKEETKRLYNQNNKLRELDRLRTNFINNISHEFRTPLASILGFSKMLTSKNHISDSTKEIVEQIQQASNRLSSLISDFLQINKTTTEGWVAHFEPSDIGEIVKQSVEEFNSLYKSHTISYIISNNYPILKTDPKLIRQVLDNLILNAIKYSPGKDSVTVSLEISTNTKELNISVSDKGIGIDKEEIPKIFNRLYRSTNPQVQKIAGSGLGLAICKEIITTLNGKIEVESKLNKGSKFTFTLPIN
ncbi:MAG: GAF domain-containing sensor histidine kinase [Candidatus Melainabacteria bacterium]|nr:GAF domain-containing sensor histidine kinase [Candidatus Melainabacteria bacterium]